MSDVILLAGGGTAGHVNPLLAVAERLRARGHEVIVLGTEEGLESRLVPQRDFELVTIPRVPFPRALNTYLFKFPSLMIKAYRQTKQLLRSRKVSAVVGFGGYASTPAYLAAGKLGIPFSVHEANALPGMANKLGARRADFVGVCFPGTPLPNATVVGMPLRSEISEIDLPSARISAGKEFGLDPETKTLLVTGGSLGAKRINEALVAAATEIVNSGWQVLHVGGSRNDIAAPNISGYVMVDYCDRMDLALALADCTISRAGASTVAEITALGIPAIYVPYAVGNGEQRLNAKAVVAAGGAILVADSEVTADWAKRQVPTLLSDVEQLESMHIAAAKLGVLDGADRMANAIESTIAKRRTA